MRIHVPIVPNMAATTSQPKGVFLYAYKSNNLVLRHALIDLFEIFFFQHLFPAHCYSFLVKVNEIGMFSEKTPRINHDITIQVLQLGRRMAKELNYLCPVLPNDGS